MDLRLWLGDFEVKVTGLARTTGKMAASGFLTSAMVR